MENEGHHCQNTKSQDQGIPPFGRKLRIVGTIFLIVLALSFAPPLHALNDSLLDYLGIIWWAVLVGLVLGGFIDYFVPDGFIVRFLGGKRKTTLFNAVVAGLLMSACSHGILAIAIQLYKKGASVPAVITLLTTGVIFTFLDRLGWIEGRSEAVQAEDVSWDRLRNFELRRSVRGVTVGSMSLANMVLWWILIGVLAAAIVGAYVPAHFFMQYLGPDVTGMTVTLLFATVLEVCSEGTSPIAFEIFNKVGVLGNPFVFLMAGVATDYTEIGLLWSNIGRRTAIWLPAIAVPQILVLGWMLNQL
jgi:uncharacterized membrane protein YraQ (UPF0718 family)